MLIWPKNFFFTKFEYGSIQKTQNFTLISKLLRKMQKISNKKVTGKRSVQNWSLYSSLLLTCKSFWQITFSRYTFFKLFPRIWNQRKILRFLDTRMVKKKLKNFWGHGVHIWVFFGNSIMQIRRKWLKGAQAWDIRERFFCTNQRLMVRWLGDCRKKLKFQKLESLF